MAAWKIDNLVVIILLVLFKLEFHQWVSEHLGYHYRLLHLASASARGGYYIICPDTLQSLQ
jgi:hypothetical protein